MDIEYWPIDKPTPYEKNPRKNENAVAAVAKSIEEFGWNVPIVVDTEGVIVAGHTRLLAAKELGLEKVPVYTAKTLTKQQIKAYRIADNRTAENAGWEIELLVEELKEIESLGGSIEYTGFSSDEVDALVRSLSPLSVEELKQKHGDPEEQDLWPKVNIAVPPETYDLLQELMSKERDAEEWQRFHGVLAKVVA